MLIAIAVENDVEIVGEPRRMMTIANGLAAAGIPPHCRNAARWTSGSDMEFI